MTRAIPVTLISGYLGAGKTTLVNQMLRQANGTRIAVLVNEFGELPIDEDLIEARDDDLISIAGGCICCSFGSDLTAALQRMAEVSPPPDHIVIEASGVALPGSIAQTVDLLSFLRLEGICVLVDCLNVKKMLVDDYIGDTIERQLCDADLIILAKPDLISPRALSELEDKLAGQWPSTPRVTAQHGQVPNAVVLGPHAPRSDRTVAPHADALYHSVVVQMDAACDAAALSRRLADPAFGLLRAKGYVRDHCGQMALIQLVGRRVDVTYPPDPGQPGVVCIGLKSRFDAAASRRLITELGAVVPDPL